MLKLRLENNTNCINAHPEVETLLVTRDNPTGVMRKVLNWLGEGGGVKPLLRNRRQP